MAPDDKHGIYDEPNGIVSAYVHGSLVGRGPNRDVIEVAYHLNSREAEDPEHPHGYWEAGDY